MLLHSFVVGASAALWRNPLNHLVWIGNVARLAVDAIRGVDLQSRHAIFLHYFVNRGRAEVLARVAVLANAAVHANVRLENNKVTRLIFIVSRAGMIDIGEAIKGQLAVAFEARRWVDRLGSAIEF